MESVFLKIRITTDNEENVQELVNRAVAWAYIRDGSLEGFPPDPVNFHVYLETYLKPRNIRDLIRRKVGNGNANYYLSYMVISRHTFWHYNIAPETLEKARLYDENATKRVKLEGLAEFKVLLPKNPTDLEIREFILNYYHKNEKPFDQRNMKAEYEYLKYHYEVASKEAFLSILSENLNILKVLTCLAYFGW